MVQLMWPAPVRRGVTLIELLVALLLSAVVVAVGSMSVTMSLRELTRADTTGTRAAALTDALHTLERHLTTAEASANDLRVVRDTAVDLLHTIGVASVCRVHADTLVLSTTTDSLPWRTVMPRAPTTDDAVRIGPTEVGVWLTRGVRDVGSASGLCGDTAVVWPGRAWQRLVLTDSLPEIRVGAIVRIMQREKWSLVRGGDGQWSLSLATWDAASSRFGVPQPLLTPLASPTAPGGAGFSAAALDVRGVALPDSALARTRVVHITLRSARHARLGQVADSVRIHVGAY
jgi:prepilin-type N-terminal cleavage/methylation domain-containing protein